MTKVSYSLKIPSRNNNDMQLVAIAKESISRHLSLILSIISLILIIGVIIYLYKNDKLDDDVIDDSDEYWYHKIISKLSESSVVIVNSVTAIITPIIDTKNITSNNISDQSSTTTIYQTSTVGTSPTTLNAIENATMHEEKEAEAEKNNKTVVIDKSWIQKTVSSIQQFFQSWF